MKTNLVLLGLIGSVTGSEPALADELLVQARASYWSDSVTDAVPGMEAVATPQLGGAIAGRLPQMFWNDILPGFGQSENQWSLAVLSGSASRDGQSSERQSAELLLRSMPIDSVAYAFGYRFDRSEDEGASSKLSIERHSLRYGAEALVRNHLSSWVLDQQLGFQVFLVAGIEDDRIETAGTVTLDSEGFAGPELGVSYAIVAPDDMSLEVRYRVGQYYYFDGRNDSAFNSWTLALVHRF